MHALSDIVVVLNVEAEQEFVRVVLVSIQDFELVVAGEEQGVVGVNLRLRTKVRTL